LFRIILGISKTVGDSIPQNNRKSKKNSQKQKKIAGCDNKVNKTTTGKGAFPFSYGNIPQNNRKSKKYQKFFENFCPPEIS
jgi:hypothetical protein